MSDFTKPCQSDVSDAQGNARIDDPTLLTDDYQENRILMIAFNVGYKI